MREKIITAYDLSPNDDVLMTAYATMNVSEIAAKLDAEPETITKQLSDLAKKLELPMEKVKQLSVWLHSGSCPVRTDEVPRMWKCPPPPNGCGEVQPFLNFDLWPIDHRCVLCVAASVERWRKQAVRLKAVHVLRETIGAISGKNTDIDLPKIESVLAEICVLEGGQHEFVKHWHEQIMAARTDRPGSKTVLDTYYQLAKLMMALQDRKKNTSHMELDELKSHLADLVLSELAKRGKEKILDLYVGNEQKLIEDMRDGQP